MKCETCGQLLPVKGNRRRRFCSDRCRKRAARAALTVECPPPGSPDGAVAASVAAALHSADLDAVDQARREMAVALAHLVDRGSVPAARELRVLLFDIDAEVDLDTLRFLERVKTPGIDRLPARTRLDQENGS